MNQFKGFSSIARKIGRAWSRKMLGLFVFLDVAILLLSVGGYCAWAEEKALGYFEWDRDREIVTGGWKEDAYDAAMRGAYRAAGADGQIAVIEFGAFLRAALPSFQLLLIVEGVLLFKQCLFGASGARRQLKPLNKLAATAQRLSQAQNERPAFDPNRMHSLEDAIDAIAPDQPDARLSTGDPDLRGLEDAVNDMVERMRAAYREQARFVSDASHELRTPISVIQGYAAMLDRWGKRDESVLNESISAIRAEADHMKALVEQLLFLARGDNGRQKLEMAPFSLSGMIREVCEESGMIDDSHDWRCTEPPTEVMCVGDAAFLKQTARILTDNAAKYTPKGGQIALRAFYRGGMPCFEVQDSGMGIAQADIPNIFERFYRADPARTGDKAPETGSSGTGLGLSIAKWIVERHGGYFEVLSRPNIGTRITVCLPPANPTEEKAP